MSGRMPTAPHLQVMSPRTQASMTDTGATSADVDMSGPIQGPNLITPAGQLIAQAQPTGDPSQDTPVKLAPRNELAEVVDAHVRFEERSEAKHRLHAKTRKRRRNFDASWPNNPAISRRPQSVTRKRQSQTTIVKLKPRISKQTRWPLSANAMTA